MTTQAPPIDERTRDEIVSKVCELAQTYTTWQPPSTENPGPDPGLTLIRIFSRMTELVIERLNQVPEKNFLAFLDLIGTQILPPQPARVPLTFQLAAGSPVDARVPARTQAAAPPAEGEETEVIYETDRELVVTTAQLTAVFVRDPGTDRYGHYTDLATAAEVTAFPAFQGNQPIEHSLYLARDDFFTLPAPKSAQFTIASPDAARFATLPIVWLYWDGENWQSLPITSTAVEGTWQVFIADLPTPAPRAIDGLEAGWIKAQLAMPLPPHAGIDDAEQQPGQIGRIEVSVRVVRSDLAPDLGFANTVPLDMSKDFYPFGEKPRLSDTLYLANSEVFARAGATVTVDVALSNPNPDHQEPDPDNPPDPPLPVLASPELVLAWEVWNGQAWRELGRSSRAEPALPGSSEGFSDGTQAFTRHGQVKFALPEMGQSTVNGEISYWMRVRIARGHYGHDAYYRPATNEQGRPITTEQGQRIYELVPATFAPPLIQSLRLGYVHEPSGPLAACRAYNDFVFVDHTDVARSSDARFSPFTPTTETRPALYLGFDRPFANRTMTLYTGVEPPLYDTASDADRRATAAPARVSWMYAGPAAWLPLGAQDETDTLTERGLITFIGPHDLTARTEFGLERYWLRARWEEGVFAVPPRLRRVLTNTTWASQATTIRNEILGSSSGEPDQVFHTSKTPVLRGPNLEVREPELPTVAERDIIAAEEGEDAITTVSDAGDRPVAIWVRWHQVTDFHGSGPRDRHYVLDHLTGAVYFGDGQHGMIPPQGRNALRAALYRTGGGTRGNRPAGTIVQLKSAVPYVDGVTHDEPTAGGAEQETLDNVKERGPKALRHRHRAVTAQDFEDLAYEASPNVARVRAIVPHYDAIERKWMPPYDASDAGRVGLIIVPHSTDIRPTPSLELIDRVEAYILARAAPTLDLWIAGPDWVQVTVSVTIAPVSFEGSDALIESVMTRLQRFLHPLQGGSAGDGWAFGRKPHKSDLYALLESIDGVDHVRTLQVQEEEMGTVRPDRFLVFSGMHAISLVSPQEGA